jgi:tRNA(adenine34) deaminase
MDRNKYHQQVHHPAVQHVTHREHLSSGLFTMPAEAIADSLASKEISPQGPSSGLRLLTFYISYAGKRLSPARLRNLEKAKKLLADRVAREMAERERALQRKIA